MLVCSVLSTSLQYSGQRSKSSQSDQKMGQTQGHELPFDIGDRFTSLSGKSIWEVHSGRRKMNGEPVTVFVFDYTDKSPDDVKRAQSAHLRLKTLRHPNILKYIDGIELPTTIYMVTEVATPLEEYLDTSEGRSTFSTSWGLHQVIKAISFLSKDCGLVHRNVCLSSVFVDSAGEWKLGGVEFMYLHSDTSVPAKSLNALRRYDPPEMGKPGAAKKGEKWATDMWGLGCLVWEVFNGPLSQVSALRSTAKIPKNLVPHYCEMVSANPRSRPNPSDLLNQLREHGGFLANHHISIALTIEEVQIMEPAQRNDFFSYLNKHIDAFPKNFSKCKILPQLLNAFEFGGAGSSVLAPLFKLGSLLDEEDYQKKIVPCVVKMFSSTDRATRLNLLKQLDHIIGHLHTSTVNQIFPNIADGFSDTVPAMREQTIKAMVLVAPKLSGAAVCGQLLKHLAKCQMDEVPAIRVNTNICLGKIAPHLDPGTRRKVLATAFMRALKDPFPAARIAAINGMATTHSFYSTSDLATKLLPSLCAMTLDKEKSVRDEVFKTLHLFLNKLERISEDPQAALEQEKAEAAGTSSWTGWAVSSLTSKFYKAPTTSTGPSGGSQKQPDEPKKEVTKPTSKPVREEREKTPPPEESGGWDDEEWEDFSTEAPPPANTQSGPEFSQEREAIGDSDMEGWEDDGWGDIDSEFQTKAPQTAPSSGADFFDTFDTKSSSVSKPQATQSEDFFDAVQGPWSAKSSKKEKSPPPLVSASLFSGGGGGSGGGDRWGDGEGGWGEWNDNLKEPPKQSSKAPSSGMQLGSKEHSVSKSPTTTTTSTTDGWGDFDDSNWGTLDETPSKNSEDSELSKQEQLKKKRDERRLKQQAAREKRAAERGLKPSGLGGVKKD